MNSTFHVRLQTTASQKDQLAALQVEFAAVCNALAPIVRETRIWNRVALHHQSYHQLRARFPQLGSQMVCNAIHYVSRTCREVYQSPQSPFNVSRMVGKTLPLLRFANNCPVYFDRHTLSVKGAELSLFTLDGRMRLPMALSSEDEVAFRNNKLLEVALSLRSDAEYELTFSFGDEAAKPVAMAIRTPAANIQNYVVVEEAQ